jgi:nitroreductase
MRWWMMNNSMLEIVNFRHACKMFDKNKKINDEDMNYILEIARKSPSSFGMEAWKFLVITNDKLKQDLKPLCWNQEQITSCSHLIIILAKIDAVKPESGIPLKRFARRNMPQEKLDFYIDIYSKHLENTLSTNENIYHWTSKQTYLAASNMMSAAAELGIDSCPIEGFEKENIEKTLKLDTNKYQVSLVLPFGYRINEQSAQQRLDFDEVVEFIK